MQADAADGIDSVGGKAIVQLTIPGTCTVPANGAGFTIWGHLFTVNSATPFTSNTVKVDTIGLTTLLNLIDMFQANYYFNVAVTTSWAIVGPNFVLTLTWNECREQPRFAPETMVFTAITSLGGSGSYTNGVSPVYKDGFKIATRLGVWLPTSGVNELNTLQFRSISKFNGIEPDKACTTLGTACSTYADDAATQLATYLPALDLLGTVESAEIMKLFSLEYGTVSRASCVPVSGTFKKSNVVLGINSVFDLADQYQMRRYWPNHPQGLPPGKSVVSFLTTQPSSIPVYQDSFCWLYLLTNYQLTTGTHIFKIRFVCYKADGTLAIVTNNGFTDPALWYKAHRFDVSPKKVLTLAAGAGVTAANLLHYDVQVVIETNDGSVSINASDYVRYTTIPSCGNAETDLYFKVTTGAVGTVAVRIDEVEQTRADEIVVDVNAPCIGTRHVKAAQSGRTIVSLRNYKKVYMSFNAPNNEEWSRWVQDLQQSTEHWLRNKQNGNGDNSSLGYAERLIVPSGAISTMPYGEGIRVTISGYLQDSQIL